MDKEERIRTKQIATPAKNEHVVQLSRFEVSMWQQQDHSHPYAGPSSYYPPQQQEPLQFYGQSQDYYSAARSSLDGHVQGSMSQQPAGFGGNIQSQGGWWTAFGTGGIEGEAPLLEGKLDIYLSGQIELTLPSSFRTWHQFPPHTCQNPHSA